MTAGVVGELRRASGQVEIGPQPGQDLQARFEIHAFAFVGIACFRSAGVPDPDGLARDQIRKVRLNWNRRRRLFLS
jgi:hypothetical protein